MNGGYLKEVLYKSKGNTITLLAYTVKDGSIRQVITFDQKWFNGRSQCTMDISDDTDQRLSVLTNHIKWLEDELNANPFRNSEFDNEKTIHTLKNEKYGFESRAVHRKKHGKLDTKVYFYISSESDSKRSSMRFYLNDLDTSGMRVKINRYLLRLHHREFVQYKHAKTQEE